MKIKAWSNEIEGPSNATVEMNSGDVISIAYTNPRGESHIITVSAQHLVFIARHEETDMSILCRPGNVVELVK